MNRSIARRRATAAGAVGLVAAVLAGGILTGGVLTGGVTPAAASDRAVSRTGPVQTAAEPNGPDESATVRVPAAPGSTDTIGIDTDLYLPSSSTPAPAVLLAHGFGASKRALARDAERLRAEGFVVLAYSARGFGDSDGRISLDSVDYEVADASRLVDLLAERPEVEQRDGDPVVGVAGASYGGALALMLGATDPRIDAVVASITWNDLAQSLVPETAQPLDGSDPLPGVFKQGWASQLFGAAASPWAGSCGRFTATLCTLYTKLIGGGTLDDADRALLDRSSPASVLSDMTAPTLLLQGREDTLFGLDQADANARAIAAAGAVVKVSWFAGGHDGGLTGGTSDAVDSWLTSHLLPTTAGAGGTGDAAGTDAAAAAPSTPVDGVQPFEFTVPASARSFAETRVADEYPGLSSDVGDGGATTRELELGGRPNIVVNPPGGLPAIITSLPGTGSLDSFIDGISPTTPTSAGQDQQRARFASEALDDSFVLAGTPTVEVAVAMPRFRGQPAPTSTEPIDVVLFAQLRVESGDANTAVGGGVAPFRVRVPADGTVAHVLVSLPATTWRFEAGDVVRVSIRTTDAAYQGSEAAASVVVDADGPLILPTVAATDPTETAGTASPTALIGIPIVLLIAAILALIAARSSRRRDAITPEAAPSGGADADEAPPLVIRGLTKDYRNGFRAVDDLSFEVRRGQVLGLLGPNGAGKTTALRMVTGLLRPDAGEIEIFGHRVVPGSPVLTRVGCFIEGPGFLPHLSGRRNLQLFWAASGRPQADARLDEALAIADLGAAIDRRVGGYSQGMRQRLAIAQAMLGMPELLILDEPTNGLDPPQIFALRGVLRRYAASGRTVIVSSHLLGEVEQTCSDVVVMASGRLLAAGTVAELAGDSSELTIEVTDVDAAVAAIAALDGAEASVQGAGVVRVLPGDRHPEEVVAALTANGIGVRSVVRGRHLEETFLAMIGSSGSETPVQREMAEPGAMSGEASR